jgi:hypothetical protein
VCTREEQCGLHFLKWPDPRGFAQSGSRQQAPCLRLDGVKQCHHGPSCLGRYLGVIIFQQTFNLTSVLDLLPHVPHPYLMSSANSCLCSGCSHVLTMAADRLKHQAFVPGQKPRTKGMVNLSG